MRLILKVCRYKEYGISTVKWDCVFEDHDTDAMLIFIYSNSEYNQSFIWRDVTTVCVSIMVYSVHCGLSCL